MLALAANHRLSAFDEAKVRSTIIVSNIVRFGIFDVDLDRRELRRKGVHIKLQQQPFEILRLLVTHPGELVSRELIQKTLWPDDLFVDFERSINTAIMRLRQALRDSASTPTYIETVAGIGYRLIPSVADNSPAVEGKSRIGAIAILPLQDLSSIPDTEYFVDGLTDALVTAMAVESDLRVVSRSSMRRYKDSPLSVRQIAKALEVQAMVEGSILRSGDRIRISVRLLDASQDRHLWAQTYERDLRDILVLQQEIADAIVNSASAIIKEGSRPSGIRQINPRAYESFLRGNFLLSTRTANQLAPAAQCYESAMFLEPQWAAPIAMLGECCRIQQFYNYGGSKELLSKAESLTEKALRLDPNNGQANATAGALLAFYEWNWSAGLEKIRLALTRDPRSSDLEHLCSQILLHMGRYDEALVHADIALSLDPSSLRLWSYRAQIFLYARRYAECIQESERILEQNPSSPMVLLNYGGALAESGRLHEALVVADQAFTTTGWSFALIGRMNIRRHLGHAEEARADMELLEQHHKEHICSPAMLAWGHMVMGDIERSYDYLEASAAERDANLSLVFHLPNFDPIRHDERFLRILRQMHLDA